MTAVWIALGAVGISLFTVFISLNAAQAKTRKEADGGSGYADGGNGGRDAADNSSDGGSDSGGGGD